MATTSSQVYLNMHVRDVKQSMAFFKGLGFEFNTKFSMEDRSACVVIGDNVFVMLLAEDYFKSMTQKEVVDTDKHAQLTIVLSVESREKVDEIVNMAESLGGKSLGSPEDYGFMYQWGFQDLDGHMWAVSAA